MHCRGCNSALGSGAVSGFSAEGECSVLVILCEQGMHYKAGFTVPVLMPRCGMDGVHGQRQSWCCSGVARVRDPRAMAVA